MDKSICSKNKVKSKLPSQLAGPKCCSPHPRAALSSKVEFDIAGSGFPLDNPRLTEVRLWGHIVFGLRSSSYRRQITDKDVSVQWDPEMKP